MITAYVGGKGGGRERDVRVVEFVLGRTRRLRCSSKRVAQSEYNAYINIRIFILYIRTLDQTLSLCAVVVRYAHNIMKLPLLQPRIVLYVRTYVRAHARSSQLIRVYIARPFL